MSNDNESTRPDHFANLKCKPLESQTDGVKLPRPFVGGI